jgi:hypothetical protein
MRRCLCASSTPGALVPIAMHKSSTGYVRERHDRKKNKDIRAGSGPAVVHRVGVFGEICVDFR